MKTYCFIFLVAATFPYSAFAAAGAPPRQIAVAPTPANVASGRREEEQPGFGLKRLEEVIAKLQETENTQAFEGGYSANKVHALATEMTNRMKECIVRDSESFKIKKPYETEQETLKKNAAALESCFRKVGRDFVGRLGHFSLKKRKPEICAD